MKVTSHYRSACALSAAFLAAAPFSPAVDLGKANPFNWFKDKEKNVPATAEKQAQEATASAMIAEAKAAQAKGNRSRALDIYKSVVKQYPFTSTAAEAQFEYACLLRANDKLQDSFDAFQKAISDYRESPRFIQAVQQQFEIAEEARSGKKQLGFVMLVPVYMEISKNEIVKMYQGIIKNAPYSKFAPLSQFAIGEVFQDKGEKLLADAAFQSVVDNYAGTPQASEAQFRIGAISSSAAKRTQDSSNIVKARDALEVYRAAHPAGERIGEVDAMKQLTNELGASRSLEIAKFYEKTGKTKAAAIYYNEAMKTGTSDAAAKARERLAALSASHPEEMKDNSSLGEADFTIPAAMNLKHREDYAGPPAPELAKLGKKPKMRVEKDEFMPIPLKEPELPMRPAAAPVPGMLLPSASGDRDKSLQLPIPPAPGMSAPNASTRLGPPEPPAPIIPPEPKPN